MDSQFKQPKRVINVEVNKQAIARDFGIKHSEVAYIDTATPVDTYKVLYDKATQTYA